MAHEDEQDWPSLDHNDIALVNGTNYQLNNNHGNHVIVNGDSAKTNSRKVDYKARK